MAPWRYCRFCNYTPSRPEVMLLVWQTQLCCKSCFIEKLEAWNAKLNAMADARDEITRIIHGQQGYEGKPSGTVSKDQPVDTSQDTDVKPTRRISSRPGIHGPQDRTEKSGTKAKTKSLAIESQDKTVDTQSQDWPNRKAAEVQHPCTFSSPDIDTQGVNK